MKTTHQPGTTAMGVPLQAIRASLVIKRGKVGTHKLVTSALFLRDRSDKKHQGLSHENAISISLGEGWAPTVHTTESSPHRTGSLSRPLAGRT